MLNILSYVTQLSVCHPWRSVCSGPLPIFHLGSLSSWSGLKRVLIYFGDLTLVRGIIDKNIFLYSLFPFHFADVFFSHVEAFQEGQALPWLV